MSIPFGRTSTNSLLFQSPGLILVLGKVEPRIFSLAPPAIAQHPAFFAGGQACRSNPQSDEEIAHLHCIRCVVCIAVHTCIRL